MNLYLGNNKIHLFLNGKKYILTLEKNENLIAFDQQVLKDVNNLILTSQQEES